MYVQVNIGRATNKGTTLSYDEWQAFMDSVRYYFRHHLNVDERYIETHQGTGYWPGAGHEESAHISAIVSDDQWRRNERDFLAAISAKGKEYWQDAVALIATDSELI